MPDHFYAHSGLKPDLSDGQPLHAHLLGVAAIAATSADRFGAAAAAHLAGLLHDLGKYTPEFQRRLRGGPPIDHSGAGALAVRDLPDAVPVMRTVLAYLIAGHHAGLPDAGKLRERLDQPIVPPDPVWRDEIVPDGRGLLPTKMILAKDMPGFQLAFLGRMIFSCLIDADRQDTAAFDRTINGLADPQPWPRLPEIVDALRGRLDAYMGRFTREREIDEVRGRILDHVRGKAGLAPGFFTLTVPTGGGKTLASLSFALDHAKAKGLQRIVYAIPFTSIIDQTVGIFEEALGDGVVLAHHSGFDFDEARDECRFATDEKTRAQLAMQDWAAPVVVTTNVQLFESLFSNRPSRCRKLQGLARSVIVLDEAQTIPLHVLRPCLAALNELVRNYGCSVVICTATQPAVLAPEYVGGLAIAEAERVERELAPDPAALHAALKRVTVRFAGTMSDADVVAALADAPQALVIVNTRKHALDLYEAARTAFGAAAVVHLTTRQYGADRRRILDDVKRRLAQGEPCRLIATSLVEAGVDLDFPAGWRAEAGLDSIAQAAGRVNREGRNPAEASILTVFTPDEAKPPRDIDGLIGDRQRAAIDWDDALAPTSIRAYFREVYWRTGSSHDATQTNEGKIEVLDRRIFGVSGNTCSFKYGLVGEHFRLIKDGLAPVIVATEDEAKAVLARLKNPAARAGAVARDLQPYVVPVPPKARNHLLAAKRVAFAEAHRFGDQFCVLQGTDLYRNDIGLLWDDPTYLAVESTIG